MKNRFIAAFSFTACLLLFACGEENGKAEDVVTDDVAPTDDRDEDTASDHNSSDCPDISGNWRFGVNCTSTQGNSTSSFVAEVTQNDCEITLIQRDDNTPAVWTSTGTIDQDGKTNLVGEFGFSSSDTCTGNVTGSSWVGECVTDTLDCEFDANKS